MVQTRSKSAMTDLGPQLQHVVRKVVDNYHPDPANPLESEIYECLKANKVFTLIGLFPCHSVNYPR